MWTMHLFPNPVTYIENILEKQQFKKALTQSIHA